MEAEQETMPEAYSGDSWTNTDNTGGYAAPEMASGDRLPHESPLTTDSGYFRGEEDARLERQRGEEEMSAPAEQVERNFEQAFQAAVEEHVEEAVQHRLLANNLLHAQNNYGEEFEAAYKAILESGSPALVQQVLSHDNPGETMVHWFRRARMIAEIPDGDVDAWVRQRYAELGGNNPGGRVAPPPSLVGARGAGQAFSESIPDNAFSYAFGK